MIDKLAKHMPFIVLAGFGGSILGAVAFFFLQGMLGLPLAVVTGGLVAVVVPVLATFIYYVTITSREE